jgi:hypothetical protein
MNKGESLSSVGIFAGIEFLVCGAKAGADENFSFDGKALFQNKNSHLSFLRWPGCLKTAQRQPRRPLVTPRGNLNIRRRHPDHSVW